MKKFFLAILASSVIVGANAYAINLGKGFIGSGDRHIPNTTARLNLDALKDGAIYNITCNISDPDAQAYPVTLRFDIENNFTGKEISVLLDGKKLASHQGQLKDNNEHIVLFPNVQKAQGEVLTITWLDGEGIVDPVDYNCSAFPVVGLTK